MMMKLTQEEAMAFRERWRLANERIDQELLNTPPEVKLKQLAALFEAVATFGWAQPQTIEDEQARHRWAIIRKSYAKSN